MKNNYKKSLKIIAWIMGSILGLIILLLVLIQIPYFQNWAKDQAVTFLENKIKTKVLIGNLSIGFPKAVVLHEVYFEDQNKDTLLSAKQIKVDISLLKLINNTLEISLIDLKDMTVSISKNKENSFNFDYISKAFESKEPTTDEAGMAISIDEIKLKNIHFRFNDAYSKSDVVLKISHLETAFKTFDLDNLEFDLPEIQAKGFDLKLNQGIAETTHKVNKTTEQNTKETPLKINIQKLDLSLFKISYHDENSKQNASVDFSHLVVELEKIDIPKQNIVINSIKLDHLNGAVLLGKTQAKPSEKVAETASENPNWKAVIKTITIANSNLQFDDTNATKTSKGLDYAHLNVKDINLKASEMGYSSSKISGKIASFNFTEKSGFVLHDLKTNFSYTDKQTLLSGLYLKTPQTLIKDTIQISYPSVEALSEEKNLKYVTINAHINQSTLGFKDILLLVPTLADTKPFKNNPNEIIYINAAVTGRLDHLKIDDFKFQGFNNSVLTFKGSIVGLPNIDQAKFNFQEINLKSNSAAVYALVPDNTIPTTISVPHYFQLKGNFVGSINNFKTVLDLNSSYGKAFVEATFDQTRKNNEKYLAKAALQNFDVGQLTKDKSVGKISANFTVQGTRLDPNVAKATFSSEITSANYNNYTYNNIAFDGSVNNGSFAIKANAKDANLKFDLVASGKSSTENPAAKVDLQLEFIDLQKLNLHAGALKLKGNLVANFDNLLPENLNGTLKATDFLVALENEQFPLDTITMKIVSTVDKDSLYVKSPFATINLNGHYNLATLSDHVLYSFSTYFNSEEKRPKKPNDNSVLNFDILIKDEPILMKLEPKIKALSVITLKGNYNSVNDSIVVDGSIPRLNYEDVDFTNTNLKINTVEKALVYNLNTSSLKTADFKIPQTNITGKIANNTIDYLVAIIDPKKVKKYVIGGNFKAENGHFENVLDQNNFILNYEPWDIDEKNSIRINNNTILINNLNLTNGLSSLLIQSKDNSNNAPLTVEFKDFDLKTLSSIAESNFELGGKINGTADILNLNTTPVFIADISIADFAIKNDTVGEIDLKINNKIKSIYAIHLGLSGNDNDVSVIGDYNIGDSSFDFEVVLKALQMKTAQAFSLENIKDAEGYLSGKITINGAATHPNILGKVKFNQVGFNVMSLNSKFKLMNDEVWFQKDKIVFNSFKIKDENENQLVLDGTINSAHFANLGFDLQLKAANFRAINSKAKDNDLFYGKLFLDNNITIKGDVESPIVTGKIKINADTDFSIVLPQENPAITNREDIVEFIDQDQPVLITVEDPMKKITQTEIKGLTANFNIEVDKEATISIIIDQANGDFLKLQGEAQLNGGIDPSGKTTLTGKYEFTTGTYEMNFNLIKRKFDIQAGSYILWTGEPTNANVAITAVYKSDVAPLDLVDDQLSGVSDAERNTYKQRIPFETELKMNGELLQPEISFDIKLTDGNNAVSTDVTDTTEAKLEQIRQEPEALNKQVFAILLLNRFIGENPFQSETSGLSAGFMAKQSASRILSEQLNNLSKDLISGFELDFDLETTENYSTGEKENNTDLNVGLSKQLLNDRIKITIGSSIGLEGNDQVNQQSNTIAGDVSADYLITKDGRYKLKAYRKNDYQVALEGQVIETGVAFIITMNYNKFKELFQKTKKEAAKKKKNSTKAN